MRDSPFLSYEEVIGLAGARVKDEGFEELDPGLLRKYAEEGNQILCRRTEAARGKLFTVLTPGKRLYRLPNDCIKPIRVSMVYPGDEGETDLGEFADETDIMDGFSRDRTAQPLCPYLIKERTHVGLYPVSDLGGFEGYITAGGAATITLPSTASATTDFYKDLAVTLLDGPAAGDRRTCTAYNGVTKVLTVDSNWTGAPLATNRVQVHPDSLVVEYVRDGNVADPKARVCTVNTALEAATHYSVGVASPLTAPPGYFVGYEAYFTLGNLKDERTRVVEDLVFPAHRRLTFDPELREIPASTDTLELRQCPNFPAAFHLSLVDFVVARALEGLQPEKAQIALTSFERALFDAQRLVEPVQQRRFHQVRNVTEEW